MSVQLVSGSNLNISKQEAKEKAQAFVALDDYQLQRLARVSSYNPKEAKSDRNKMALLIGATPFVHSVIDGSIKGDSLGSKAMIAGKTGAGWAVALGVLGVYGSLKHLVNKHNPSLANFEAQNPLVSFVADMGMFVVGTFFAHKAIGKVLSHSPSISNKIGEYSVRAHDALNKTSLNTKILPKISEGLAKFKTSMPKLAGAGNYMLRNSIWILFGSTIALSMAQRAKSNSKVENNYQKLKEIQLQTAQYLDNNPNI